jgi:hypothetical protein
LITAPVIGAVDATQGQWIWFALVLGLSLAFTALTSPRRRRAVGGVRFMFGRLLAIGAPLLGVIVVRGAVALGHREAGENFILAQFAGIFWGGVFVIVSRIALALFPPTGWLLREHRRAHREASFLRAAFRPRGVAAG